MANIDVLEARINLLRFKSQAELLGEAALQAYNLILDGDVDGAVKVLEFFEAQANDLGHLLTDGVLGHLDASDES